MNGGIGFPEGSVTAPFSFGHTSATFGRMLRSAGSEYRERSSVKTAGMTQNFTAYSRPLNTPVANCTAPWPAATSSAAVRDGDAVSGVGTRCGAGGMGLRVHACVHVHEVTGGALLP